MSYRNPDDNIYPVGTRIFAREAPAQVLVITKYYQRIYFCAIPGDMTLRRLAYFEAELLPLAPGK